MFHRGFNQYRNPAIRSETKDVEMTDVDPKKIPNEKYPVVVNGKPIDPQDALQYKATYNEEGQAGYIKSWYGTTQADVHERDGRLDRCFVPGTHILGYTHGGVSGSYNRLASVSGSAEGARQSSVSHTRGVFNPSSIVAAPSVNAPIRDNVVAGRPTAVAN